MAIFSRVCLVNRSAVWDSWWLLWGSKEGLCNKNILARMLNPLVPVGHPQMNVYYITQSTQKISLIPQLPCIFKKKL